MSIKRRVATITAVMALSIAGITIGAGPAMADTALPNPAVPVVTQTPTDSAVATVASDVPEPDPVPIDESTPPATTTDEQPDAAPGSDQPSADTPGAPATSEPPTTDQASSAPTPTPPIPASPPVYTPAEASSSGQAPAWWEGTRIPVSGGALAQVRNCYWGDIYTTPGNTTPDAHIPDCNVDVHSSVPGDFTVQLSDVEATPEFRSLGDSSGFEWAWGSTVSFTVHPDLGDSSGLISMSPQHPVQPQSPVGVPYSGIVKVGESITVTHDDLMKGATWASGDVSALIESILTPIPDAIGDREGGFTWTPTAAGTFNFIYMLRDPISGIASASIDGTITVTPADAIVIPDPVITPPAEPVVAETPTPERAIAAAPTDKLAETGSDIELPLLTVLVLLTLGCMAVSVGRHRTVQW